MESVTKGDLETPTPPYAEGARSDAASVVRGPLERGEGRGGIA
jgi:hypothetical protein